MGSTGNPILDNPTLKATLAAQMAQQNAPPPPAIQMPAGGAAASPSILSGMPSMPSTPQPPVGAPRGTVAGDTNELGRKLSTGSGISQIHSKIEDSGFGQKHPVLSKVLGIGAQGLAELGDIGLRTVAPAVDLAIPGTSLHHLADVRGDQRQVAGTVANAAKEAGTQEAGARTGEINEQTSEMPGKSASEEGLQGAQAHNLESEARDRDQAASYGPQLATAYSHAVNEAMKAGRDPAQDPIVQQLSDAITSIQKQPPPKGLEARSVVGPDNKPMEANYNPATGKYTDPTNGQEIKNPRPYEKPNQGGMVTLIAPDPNNPGGGVVERLGAGAHITPGSQTAAGFSSMNTPTTTVRTAAARAKIVNESIPGVLDDIEKNKAQMGPILGRWNDFMQGKVGTDNPDFAALRMDLTLMATAVALAHAQGRLPENLREEFDRAINAPQQSPENLEAAIKAVQPWMQKMQDAAERPGAGGTSGKGVFNSAAWAKANPKGDVAAAKAYAKSQGYEVK